MPDERTDEILREYHGDVVKMARGIYLKAKEIRNELERSRINREDKLTILAYTMEILVKDFPNK